MLVCLLRRSVEREEVRLAPMATKKAGEAYPVAVFTGVPPGRDNEKRATPLATDCG
jgi:hypothetical protein